MMKVFSTEAVALRFLAVPVLFYFIFIFCGMGGFSLPLN